MTMKGSIRKELIDPSVRGISSGERNHAVKIPYRMLNMERNIREIAGITRTDDPFKETRSGTVIRRTKVMDA